MTHRDRDLFHLLLFCSSHGIAYRNILFFTPLYKSSDVTRKQVGNLVKPWLSLITPQYIQRGA